MPDDRRLVREGDWDDPAAPDGNVYELPGGHRYEMGTRHECGVEGCPADTSWIDSGDADEVCGTSTLGPAYERLVDLNALLDRTRRFMHTPLYQELGPEEEPPEGYTLVEMADRRFAVRFLVTSDHNDS